MEVIDSLADLFSILLATDFIKHSNSIISAGPYGRYAAQSGRGVGGMAELSALGADRGGLGERGEAHDVGATIGGRASASLDVVIGLGAREREGVGGSSYVGDEDE